ncbi:ABC transporter substrate-binding protein [Clostridium cibarium]|uniref:ABC transporter substrate-binding protein n=1 Tax=Clostridium cibarium TaxID=2762247 RepID=A0ABR8PPS3_9CLOT|nr:MqnA/MqnD/SBP family protein [Clostridium cibarium]MBD7910181.1 ABC transporter substrate-binding protein [Clostridium cibarium]
MKKKFALILSIIFALGVFTQCSSNEQPKETKNIKAVVPDGLTAMATAKLMKEKPEVEKGYNIEYSIEKTPENIVSEVLKGETDIAIVPSNVAATQYNKNAGYVIAGTIGWGSFYLVSAKSESSLEQLKGKEIFNIGKGLTPDLITKIVLKEKGYNIESDFNFSYVNGVTELTPAIMAGKANYAVVPEPALSQVLSKKQDTKILMDFNEEWKKAYNSEYGFPQSTLIVKKDLVEQDNKFIQEFLNKLEESCKFASDNNYDLPSYCEEIGVSVNKDMVSKAVEKANIKYVSIKDSYKEYNTYFNKLNDLDPKTIGGKVPDEGVYMEK